MSKPSSLLAGIDIGGTNIRCALATLDAPGQILTRTSARTPLHGGVDAILDLIEHELNQCQAALADETKTMTAIGCTAPGITDAVQGVVIDASNLPGWKNIALAELLTHRLGLPAVVENDVNAAALGEFAQGAGQGSQSMVYLTISTGVAAGIVVDGHLLRGYHHAAGEIGIFLPEPAHIGKNWEPSGCLEMTSAGIGLANEWAKLRGGPNTSERTLEVFKAASEGDPDATALIQRAADYLAVACVAIGTIIDPERLVLGGSIALHQTQISDRIRDVLQTTMIFPPTVSFAALGGDAPLMGALMLAAKKADQSRNV